LRPRRRPRVARRRDGEIRQIRGNSTPRYPGVDVPPPAETPPREAAAPEDGRRLAPARDAGIAVHARTHRVTDSADKRRRAALIWTMVAIVALVGAAIGWREVSDQAAAAKPVVGQTSTPAPRPAAQSHQVTAAPSKPLTHPAATPIFAYYKSLKLHLPVAMLSLTEIGFHQASYGWALRMKTLMRDAKMSTVAKTKTTGRNRLKQPVGDKPMTGQVLRMWRNRPGKPDTAVDVGALAGTTILSPVDGTVVRIKPYKLYGRYDDYELHIIPDHTSGLDVVMIHLTGLKCHVGEHVEAGVTPVAKIRKFSDKFHDQLAEYTKSPGDHVHIQVNNSNYPGYKGLQGAVDPTEYGD
jgi:murein DD-endopeptidase MepM/ murein hydrolase activator NlpD